jgi:hypothetical protein
MIRQKKPRPSTHSNTLTASIEVDKQAWVLKDEPIHQNTKQQSKSYNKLSYNPATSPHMSNLIKHSMKNTKP